MIKINNAELEQLKDGCVYKVKFKDCSVQQVGEWMRCMINAVTGRNITFIPEISQFFEIVEEN